MSECRDLLLSGLQELDLPADAGQIDALLYFLELIEKWNRVYNLTAIRDREAMAALHLLDSLAVLPHLQGPEIIDIGTGAGLPGIPLAICAPHLNFQLLDSNAKKTRFVQQAILELSLQNVSVCHRRVEEFRPEKQFQTIITRAFASLPQTFELARHLLARQGILLAMKGQFPEQEFAGIDARVEVIPLQVPGVDAERCLIKISAIGAHRQARH